MFVPWDSNLQPLLCQHNFVYVKTIFSNVLQIYIMFNLTPNKKEGRSRRKSRNTEKLIKGIFRKILHATIWVYSRGVNLWVDSKSIQFWFNRLLIWLKKRFQKFQNVSFRFIMNIDSIRFDSPCIFFQNTFFSSILSTLQHCHLTTQFTWLKGLYQPYCNVYK